MPPRVAKLTVLFKQRTRWGELGQFRRHVVGGGVDHLGGRCDGVGRGFSGPGDPSVERGTQGFDSTLIAISLYLQVVFWTWFWKGIGEWRGGPVSTLEGRRWSEPPCWVEQRVWRASGRHGADRGAARWRRRPALAWRRVNLGPSAAPGTYVVIFPACFSSSPTEHLHLRTPNFSLETPPCSSAPTDSPPRRH